MDKLGGSAATDLLITSTRVDISILSYTLILIACLLVVFVGYILVHLSSVNKRYHLTEYKRRDDSEFIKLSYRLILKITTSFDKVSIIVVGMFVFTFMLWILLMIIDFSNKGR